jgi:tetratricopeptide (TPR) repeat protein
MPPRYRIFISSPSDVFAERERVERVIARFNGEFGGGILEAVRWEHSYYTASHTFQDQILLPSEADLVVLILWKRLGIELPPDYRRPDGTTPTGTEYEFENAMEAAKAKGAPDVLVYRKVAPVLLDAERVEMECAQFEALKHFWTRWFCNEAGHFTAAYQSFESTDQFEKQVEDHIRQWLTRHKVASPGVTWLIDLKGSPFRGLQPFEASHSDVFFGRRRVIERARERLADAAKRGMAFLLVLGASGSGKSSLARAGLAPRLTQPGAIPGVDVWRQCVLRPSEGDTPLHALARALYGPGALPELAEGDNPTPGDLAALFANAPEAAARAIRLALNRSTDGLAERERFDRPVVARMLLVVDQFEEALSPSDARDRFARALQALAATGVVWIIATLRSDLYGPFQASTGLMAMRDGGTQLDLLPPGATELREIVSGPATAAGLKFDMRSDGVALEDELTAQASQPNALPLLQLTLDALFEARDRATNLLTFAAYEALGGLSGVVERRAEATLAALDVETAAVLPAVLRALVDVTEEGAVTGRAAPIDQAAETTAAKRFVQSFVDARLLVAETHGDETTLRVAHDALLSSWPRAAALIAADRDMLRTRARVDAATRRWAHEDRHADFLLPSGRPLAEAADLAAHRPEILDPESRAFIAASQASEAARQSETLAHAQRELRLQADAQQARADGATRLVRRTRAAVAVVSVLLAASAGAAIYANSQRQEAQRQTVEAERNFKAALDGGAIIVNAVNDHLRDGGMSVEVARTLLGTAQTSLGKLVQKDAAVLAPPALQDTQRLLQDSFSSVQLALCDSVGARDRASDAVAIAEAVVAQAPADARRLALVQALDSLGQAARGDGDPAGAITAYRRAEQMASAHVGSDDDWGKSLRQVRRDMAVALLDQSDYAGALSLLKDDLAWQQRQAEANSEDVAVLALQAGDFKNIGFATLAQNDPAAAAEALNQEANILSQLAGLQPANLEWQRALSINAQQSSRMLALQGNRAEALAKAQQGADLASTILAHDPNNAQWQRDLVFADVRLGQLLAQAGNLAGTVRVLQPAITRAKSLSGDASGSLLCKGDAARLHNMAGLALMVTGDSAGAAQELEAGLAVVKDAVVQAPNDAERVHALVEAEKTLALAYALSSKPQLAAEHYSAGIEVAQRLIARDPGNLQWQAELAELRLGLGDALRHTDDLSGALAAYTEDRNAAVQIAAAHPGEAEWQHEAVVATLRVATAHMLAKQPDEHWAAMQEAMAGAEKLVAEYPDVSEWQADLLDVKQSYAAAEAARNEFTSSLTHYKESLGIADALVQREPTNTRWRTAQAIALSYVGLGYRFNQQLDEAQSYFDRSKAAFESLNPQPAAHAP